MGRALKAGAAVRSAAVFSACMFLTLACGDDPGPVRSTPGEPSGECNSVETRFENGSASHVADCSSLDYPMSPPVFGDHYPTWAAYQTYNYPVPLGFLVHNLEHGAIILFYNCPEGCADEVAAAQELIDALPADPRCQAPIEHQVIMVPEPSLEKRWGIASWGSSLTGDCLDPVLFRKFYGERLGQGREDLCYQGRVLGPSSCG
jgi:hypothetical protein